MITIYIGETDGHIEVPAENFKGDEETARSLIQNYINANSITYEGSHGYGWLNKTNGKMLDVATPGGIILNIEKLCRWCDINPDTLQARSEGEAPLCTAPSLDDLVELENDIPIAPSALPPVPDTSNKATSKSAATPSNEHFEKAKGKLQKNFMTELNVLQDKLVKEGADASVYTNLMRAQTDFLAKLQPNLPKEELDKSLKSFRTACKTNVDKVDKIMGHGFLYRAVEALVRGALILVVGAGMGLGWFFGQGFAKDSHCTWYDATFFAWNKTAAQGHLKQFQEFVDKVLNQFKEDLLEQPARDEDASARVARGPAT